MVDLPDEILRHYEDIDEGQRITDGSGRLELARTQEILTRYLPDRPLRILDVGGATGVHAEWLAELGHHVQVIDPVERHVAAARGITTASGSVEASLGDARALPYADQAFDAVLLLGPLYHLTERADRLRALGEACRVVVDGGFVFAAGISRYASLFDGLARGFLLDPQFRTGVERTLVDGQHRNPSSNLDWFTTAYFHHPDELASEAREANLQVETVLGVEGLAGWFGDLASRWETAEDRDAILFASRAVEAEPSLAALSAHLLLVAVRPA